MKRVVVAALLVSFLYPVVASETLQRSVAVAESLIPVALLGLQGTDTPFEYSMFLLSAGLQTAPNVLMLYAESSGRSDLTRISRWVNFGVDSALAAGLFGVGIAYLAGAFGAETDTRSRGGFYLAMSIPAAVAAYVDFLPYSVEGPADPRADAEPAE